MALTLLSEQRSTDIDCFWKVMRYQMYETCPRFVLKFLFLSLFLLFLPFLPFSAFSKTFFLAAVIGVEITKTNTSFQLLFHKILARVITFFLLEKAFNIRDVFFFFLENGVNTYCRRVVIVILSLFSMAPKIFLVFLVFFVNLALLGRLLLIRYISRELNSGFILFGVLILLFCCFIPLEILDINLLGV